MIPTKLDGQDDEARADLIERRRCPRCEAPAGSPCRTRVGTVATEYHTGRYDKTALRSGLSVKVPGSRQPGRAWKAGPEVDPGQDLPIDRPGDRVGYARVSLRGQDLAVQVKALTDAGCVKIFQEKISTREAERAEYLAARDSLRPNDILTVTRLDRLGRDMLELIISATDIQASGHRLEILSGPLTGIYDPHGAGKLLFVMLAAMAEIERDFIRERTMDGLAVAAANGKFGGRPRAIDRDTLAIALARRAARESVPSIAKRLGIGRSTLYRTLELHDNGLLALDPAADAAEGGN
ncbi:recombinase family protein [Kitasatospora aburaviensis]|uniref:Recombinase family protein n=1 Tax=Kitasatospora aburaviensis TaxID=67265 RepID=A0ABW1F3H3_9ACTN